MPDLALVLPESVAELDARAKSLTQIARSAQLPASDPATLYLVGLAESSQATMRAELRRIARFFDHPLAGFPWAQLTPLHVAALRAFVADTRAPSGANLTLAALRGVTRAAVKLGLLSDAQQRQVCECKPVQGSRVPAGRAIGAAELVQLFGYLASRSDPVAVRDACAVALLYGAGLRRAEAVKVEVEDVTARGVRVVGKGNKERRVALPEGTRRAIAAWLAVRGPAPGPLLCPVYQGRRIDAGLRLAPQSLYHAMVRACRRAGLERFTPHDLRRTYMGDLLDRGVDLVTVQHLAGHADPKQTARYDRRPARVREVAAAKLTVPFGED